MKKYATSELLRLACIYAEQDRLGLIDAYSGCDSPEDEAMKAEWTEYVKQLRAYRLKRWGKTQFEKIVDEADTVNLSVA